ncbi:MAG: nitrogen fixation protein NifZ [Burkholderiales bacterium]|nr:nitrogen fixation protein NifZ [Burkholderiales bacterium]
MMEPRMPKYQWGQPVLASTDLYNDGSFPEKENDVLLVSQGSRGEIVQVGSHEESSTPVYLVEFREGLVVGCLEEEISPL